MEEEWRNVDGFPGYMVSNLGRIKSLARAVPRIFGGVLRVRRNPEVIMKQFKTGRKRNYYKVALSAGHKEKVQIGVHRLVAKAFIENQRELAVYVNHKDGNGLNNRSDNLEWVTNSENLLHASEVLRVMPIGEANTSARLNAQKVLQIRSKASSGQSLSSIAREMGVSVCTVSMINARKRWRHVPETAVSTVLS